MPADCLGVMDLANKRTNGYSFMGNQIKLGQWQFLVVGISILTLDCNREVCATPRRKHFVDTRNIPPVVTNCCQTVY